MYAAYMNINNAGTQSRTLVGVRTAAFAMAHIHKSRVVVGVARMDAVKELKVPAGETIVLQPGGTHVMLMKPLVDIDANDTVTLEFTFADGEVLSVNAKLGKLN